MLKIDLPDNFAEEFIKNAPILANDHMKNLIKRSFNGEELTKAEEKEFDDWVNEGIKAANSAPIPETLSKEVLG